MLTLRCLTPASVEARSVELRKDFEVRIQSYILAYRSPWSSDVWSESLHARASSLRTRPFCLHSFKFNFRLLVNARTADENVLSRLHLAEN